MNHTKYYLLAINLFVYTTFNPMSMRLKTALLQNKSAIKKTAILGCVTSGSTIGIFYAKKHQSQSLPDASREEQEYAQEQFKAIGIKNPSLIQLKIGTKTQCGDNIIEVPYSDRRKEMLSQKKFDDEEIFRFQATLQHEGNHAKFNHTKKGLLIHQIISTATFYATFKTNNPMVCAASLVAMAGGFYMYGLIKEQQADDHMLNNPSMLRAQAAEYREYYENDFRHQSTFTQLSDVHPHPLKRAQKLEARASKAELIQNTTNHEK